MFTFSLGKDRACKRGKLSHVPKEALEAPSSSTNIPVPNDSRMIPVSFRSCNNQGKPNGYVDICLLYDPFVLYTQRVREFCIHRGLGSEEIQVRIMTDIVYSCPILIILM